jgi:hypothetical protein
MRIIGATVAVVATAMILSSLANPALAAGKKGGGDNFFNNFGGFFDSFGSDNKRHPPKFGGPSFSGFPFGGGYGGGGGGKHHGKKGSASYTDNPGSPGVSGTNTIVYFGTCLNQAGFQQAGNADTDGFCLPYESLTGNEGSPGSGPSCTITTTSKSHGGGGVPTYARGGSEGGYGGGSTTSSQTVSGTCAAYQAANPAPTKPVHDWDDGEEEGGS